MEKKKKVTGPKKPKIRLLYYQFKESFKYVNWIYEMKGKAHVCESMRVPYEEGIIAFFKNSKAGALSAEVDIHEFANHLNIAYKKKKR